MSTLTPPKANIPVGWLMIDRRRIPVAIDPEWLRYLSQELYNRAGGTSGSGTVDLETSAFEDAGIEEIKMAAIRNGEDAAQDVDVYALREEVHELRKRIEAFEQGVAP